ncbi:MAG: hypothetical protein JXR12_05700 [Neptunomonas phycophila]|uniref:hypothetical protein n=1 Tax=Neptunomonas phycophila TaxID=1572645 RepID=UPI003B8BB102
MDGSTIFDTVMMSSGMTIGFAIVAIFIGFAMLRAMDKAIGFNIKTWLDKAEARQNDTAIAIYLAGRFIAVFWFLGQLFS